MEMGNTQLRKYEEHAYVLDSKLRAKSTTVHGRTGIIIIAIGEERLTLLEILGTEDSTFDVGERIYIGKEGRTKVQSVLGKIDYIKISDSAKNEIPGVVELIVTKNEKKFVDYINNAQPLTPRIHSLELIPGIGKTYLNAIIKEREKGPFDKCFIGSFKPARFSMSLKLSNGPFSLSFIIALRYVLPIPGINSSA